MITFFIMTLYYDYIASPQVKALFLSVSVPIKLDGVVKNFYIGCQHPIGDIHCVHLSSPKITLSSMF